MRFARLLSLAPLAAALMLAGCDRRADEAPVDARPERTVAIDPDVVMPDDAPPQEEPPAEASAVTACSADIGRARADRLVQRCIAVSPATHPPCNAANPCALIQDEIDRACQMFPAEEKPAECGA